MRRLSEVMARRVSFARRSRTEWGVRIAIVSLAAVLGYLSLVSCFANLIAGSDPARGHELAPWDGRITAALAERQFVDHPEPGAQSQSAQLARLALRQDPTAVSAVSTLGYQAQLRNDPIQTRRLFGFAQKLSRRHLQTHLWAIEDAVGRGDLAGALQHYDMALRTSRAASDLLFPIMLSALAQSDVRQHLVSTLRLRPVWGPDFISYVSAKPGDPRAIASFFIALRRAGISLPADTTIAGVNGLIAIGAFDDAWSFYAMTRRDADHSRSRDPYFVTDATTPSVFDWTPVNDASVSTSIQRGPKGGIFEFGVPPGVGGALLQQMQVLPVGSYRIEGHSIGIEQPDRSLPYWVLTCRDGREVGRVVVPNSTQTGGRFVGQLNVPANCPEQTLALMARSSDDVSGVSGQIDFMRLLPVK